MSIALNTDTRPAPQEARNPSFALCELFVLLNETMQLNAQTQGDAADDISKGIQQTADLLKTLNHNVAQFKTDIDHNASVMKSLQPYLIAFAVIGGVATIGAGFLGGWVAVAASAAG